MSGFRSSAIARAGRLTLSLTLIPAIACTGWRTQSGTPPDILAARRPSTVRVTRADGTEVVLRAPSLEGDSLAGWSGAGRDGSSRLHIPLSDIRSVAVQQVSAGKTVLLVAGLGVTAALVAALADGNDSPAPPLGGGGTGGGSGGPYVSCPLVYSWDGSTWRLDSGTFGGAIARGLARTDVDNLVYATAPNGLLRLKVANELAETDYLDALAVLAVDVPVGSSVAPDAAGELHTIVAPVPPLAAHDFAGRDALERVRTADGWHWESAPARRDSSLPADRRDGLELRFLRPPGSAQARLVLDANNTPWSAALMARFVAAHGTATQAWYDSLDGSPAMARAVGAAIARQAFLSVAVRVGRAWVPQGLAWEAGPEISKRHVVPLDLTGVAGDTVVVRLESVPSFWLVDRVAVDFSPAQPTIVHELQADVALDGEGRDHRATIARADGAADTLAHGDSLLVSFRVPPIPAGMRREYLVRSHGWYRIDSPETEPPDHALLEQVLDGNDGLSRVATARLQQAVARLENAR